MLKEAKEIKRYLREINRLLPATSQVRKKIKAMISENLNNRINESPNKDISKVIEEFGTPDTVAASYIEEMGTAEILKGYQKRKTIITIVTVGVTAALLTIIVGLALAVADAHKSNNGYYHIETSVSEEYGSN